MSRRILVSVTCDTELDPPWYKGSWENMATWTFEQGVPLFKKILDVFEIKGTFFTQGKVLERFPETVHELDRSGHHVGSHGYNHENYGNKPVKVWTQDQPVFLGDNNLKSERIEKCIDLHDRVLGKHPEAFVAPFDNVDDELLEILDDLGFKVDCSFHNYSLQMNSFPFQPLKNRELVEIPLTVLDMGTDTPKNLLEAFTYDSQTAEKQLSAYIKYSMENWPFCMVLITCHPYEFLDVKPPHPRDVLIVGQEKVEALKNLLIYFRRSSASFVTPIEVREIYRQIRV